MPRKNSLKTLSNSNDLKQNSIKKQTTFQEQVHDDFSDNYDDDFEKTYKSESAIGDSSEGKKGQSFGKTKTGQLKNMTVPNLGGFDETDEDALLMEARQQHMKIRANSLSKTRGRTDSHTPIKEVKEEDIEDDFDHNDAHEQSQNDIKSKNSKNTLGSQVEITEANNNYDSNNSQFYDQLGNSASKGKSTSTAKKSGPIL